MTRAYIALGSNLDNPVAQIKTALKELDALMNTKVTIHSSLYETSPVGVINQPNFINAVAEIETELSPLDLLDALLALEYKHHRVRQERWGPRTLDLDILLYCDQVINDERLTVPHPRIKERAFVLAPLAEIAPDLIFPDGESLKNVIKRNQQQTITTLKHT